MMVCVCAKSVCFGVCASVRSSHTCMSKHPLLIFNKSPRLYKVFLSAWSSVWMKVTKLTSLRKKKKKKELSQFIWNSVSLVSNSGQKGSFFIVKNSLKIGFIVGCCFLFNCFLVVAAVVVVAKFPYTIGHGCPGLVLQYWGQ